MHRNMNDKFYGDAFSPVIYGFNVGGIAELLNPMKNRNCLISYDRREHAETFFQMCKCIINNFTGDLSPPFSTCHLFPHYA